MSHLAGGPTVRIASGLLNGHPHYLHVGVVQISWANLIVVVTMVVVFVLALWIQLPNSDGHAERTPVRPGSEQDSEVSDDRD